MSLTDALYNHPEIGPILRAGDALEAEVMAAVPAVDLDIAYSPVLMNRGDTLEDARDVGYKAAGGIYVFKEPFRKVTAEELKVMRARYLIVRGKAMQPHIDRMFGKNRDVLGEERK